MDNTSAIIQIVYYLAAIILLIVEFVVFGYGFYKTKKKRWLLFLGAVIGNLLAIIVITIIQILMLVSAHTFTGFYIDNLPLIALFTSCVGLSSQLFYIAAAVLLVRDTGNWGNE